MNTYKWGLRVNGTTMTITADSKFEAIQIILAQIGNDNFWIMEA